jgi:hypothetical protein
MLQWTAPLFTIIKFNQLGGKASLGCIRLSAGDAKWIFDNCATGTPVIVYDDTASPRASWKTFPA